MTEKTIKTEEQTTKAPKKAPATKATKVTATKEAKAPKAAVTKAAAPKAEKAPKAVKAAKSASSATIKITLVKSLIGRLEAHKASARGLGLTKIRQTVEVLDTIENRGMINAISYLLKCEG